MITGVAAGQSWVAVATDKYHLRLFTAGRIQEVLYSQKRWVRYPEILYTFPVVGHIANVYIDSEYIFIYIVVLG